jgi:CRISPR-associated DxTHG motif protein
MHVVISALGTNKYTEVTYRFQDGQAIRSSYPVHALIQRSGVRFDQTIVLLTEKARKKWRSMQSVLGRYKETAGDIRPVRIKDGKNSEEVWQIFDVIAKVVPENAQLYIDITHGLRHLPMLLVMAAAYLRAAKNVTIRSISYGAFDLRRTNSDGDVECDVFELLPFVELFDWASAAKMFQETGNASQLAYLLRSTGARLGEEAREQINSVAQQLDEVNLALEVARPEEAMQKAHSVTQALEASAERIQTYAKPFSLLKGLLKSAFERISLPRLGSIDDRLQGQRKLIAWYFERGRIALATILTREWMISSEMRRRGEQEIFQHGRRQAIADQLSQNPPADASEGDRRRHNLWIMLRDVRNQIAHAAQSEQPQQPESKRARRKRAASRLRHKQTAGEIKQDFEKVLQELDRFSE